MTSKDHDVLWAPSEGQIQRAKVTAFRDHVRAKTGVPLDTYEDLYRWSVANSADFWREIWGFCSVVGEGPGQTIVENQEQMPGARWFTGARLNFAENLLRYRDDRIALIFKGEAQESIKMTYAELYDEVARLANGLKEAGVQSGDRVVGFMPNMPASIIAMLAAASRGATWSSCSPDFGIKGVLDRFGQIKPKVLFTANGYSFKGKKLDSLGRIADILKELPSIEKVVVVPYTETIPDIAHVPNAIHYRTHRITHLIAQHIAQHCEGGTDEKRTTVQL